MSEIDQGSNSTMVETRDLIWETLSARYWIDMVLKGASRGVPATA